MSGPRALMICLAGFVLLTLSGCGDSKRDGGSGKESDDAELASPSLIGMGFLTQRSIGSEAEGPPWITDLTIGDLDQDGVLDVVVADGRLNRVSWIRQYPANEFTETAIAEGIAGPAHVALSDLDRDGDLDILVASMGIVTPNDQKIGAVIVLENVGQTRFVRRDLVSGIDRVTDVEAADLDGDGDLDLSVAAFGYFEGEVRWMENLGDWRFASHGLLTLPGAIHAPPGDVDGDGDLDIVSLVSQDSEEVYLFRNDGSGAFEAQVVYGSTNKDFGSSGIALTDLDADGDLDIAYTNGDGFDYSTPGARYWHGLQWLENDGKGGFRFHRIGDLGGAYSPMPVDLDGDGDLDIVATSGFNDWSNPESVALACFENLGGGRFERRDLATAPTHLVVVDAADMDGDGEPELVTGGFAFYPPYDRAGRVTLWKRAK